ncbi:MAG: hypothetical protein LBC84_02230 [Prevotellaceae bacterium]|jgi:hypothetical protein|nr:hypothetical protein [Prevotellaceae bacterium]
MKTTLKFFSLFCFFTTLFFACSVKENEVEEEKTTKPDDEIFYYFGLENKKIYLTQCLDKILIRFSSDTDKERMLALVSDVAPLKIFENTISDEGYIHLACFESQDEKPISQEIIKSFKTIDQVISVAYMYQYNGGKHQGIIDEFVVQFNSSTSYKQLEELAKENGCTIGEKYSSPFVENRFTIHVPKTSELNAMQMANKFYETKLFYFSEPNFIFLNLLHM